MLVNPGFLMQSDTNRIQDALTLAKGNLAGLTPNYYWDFTNQDTIFNDVTYNSIMNTPGITGAGTGPTFTSNGLYITGVNKRLTLPLTLGSAYTIYTDFIRDTDSGTQAFILSYDDTTTANKLELLIQGATTDVVDCNLVNATVTQGTGSTAGALALGVSTKFAVRVAANDFAYYVNGSPIATSAVVTVPTLTTLRFGVKFDNTSYSRGWIKRTAIFNSALSNANMAALTT